MIKLKFSKRVSNREMKPKRKNAWDLFWYLIRTHNNTNSMLGFMRENFRCDDYNKQPSRELIKRYNINHEYSEPLIWWLLENYFNGKLIEKKDDTITGTIQATH